MIERLTSAVCGCSLSKIEPAVRVAKLEVGPKIFLKIKVLSIFSFYFTDISIASVGTV